MTESSAWDWVEASRDVFAADAVGCDGMLSSVDGAGWPFVCAVAVVGACVARLPFDSDTSFVAVVTLSVGCASIDSGGSTGFASVETSRPGAFCFRFEASAFEMVAAEFVTACDTSGWLAVDSNWVGRLEHGQSMTIGAGRMTNLLTR